jgi:DNA-binding transcriptional LysR family regulator
MLAVLAEAGHSWRIGSRVSTFAALISALRAVLGIGRLLPAVLPSDCENLQGKIKLPAAPIAEFGVYISPNPPSLADQLGAFLRDGFEI